MHGSLFSHVSEAAMPRTLSFLALLSCLTLLPLIEAAAPPASPSASQIRRWIEELGDDVFAVREAATAKLRAVGSPAEALLEKAAESKDPEVARRAQKILAEFKWGIYGDTPEKVVELIRNYQAAARSEKRPIIQKLFACGPAGSRAIIKIARAEGDPLVRKDVFRSIASGLVRSVGMLLEEKNIAGLEAMLQLALEGDVKTGARNYAAYHLLTGQLPQRIAELEAQAKKNPPGKVEAEILAYLYRARGDLAKAAQAAADAELNEVQEGILYQAGDWKQLANKPALSDTRNWVRYVGLRAAYTRLAGNTKGYDLAIKDILDRAAPIADRKEDVMPYAKALFLNARPAEALDLLKKAHNQPRLRFEILAAQLNLKAAFDVVEAARAVKSPELGRLEIAQARVLYSLGEKERAQATLKRYADQIDKAGEKSWWEALIDTEMQLGLFDEAFAHSAKMIDAIAEMLLPPLLFEKLFPDLDEEASYLWGVLGQVMPKEPTAKILARMRALLEGKASADEVKYLFKATEKAFPPLLRTPGHQRREWLATGEAAKLCKQDDIAEECFRNAGGIRAGIGRGDLLAAKKQWAQAAVRYLEAYRLGIKGPDAKEAGKLTDDFDSLPALALYLHGDALVKAGRLREGKEKMERGHLLPLGSGEARYYLARALLRRGHRDGARREYDLLRRVGEPNVIDPEAYYTGEGLRYGGIAAATRKDYFKAADGYEQAFLRCLNPGLNFLRPIAYVTVPAHIHRMRALALAKAGQLDEAKTETLRALAALPGSVDVALDLMPIFEEKRRTKDADELFQGVFAVYEKVIRDFPKHATAYNQAAWLSACCRRSLDKGLSYARKAVELSPKTAAYHDTLAEVLFQLGKKAEAVAAQKRAVALSPARVYFRKQLKRIEAGDPKAARPDEDEE
jgi:tetratricopeptide (TPR) repeat protein